MDDNLLPDDSNTAPPPPPPPPPVAVSAPSPTPSTGYTPSSEAPGRSRLQHTTYGKKGASAPTLLAATACQPALCVQSRTQTRRFVPMQMKTVMTMMSRAWAATRPPLARAAGRQAAWAVSAAPAYLEAAVPCLDSAVLVAPQAVVWAAARTPAALRAVGLWARAITREGRERRGHVGSWEVRQAARMRRPWLPSQAHPCLGPGLDLPPACRPSPR